MAGVIVTEPPRGGFSFEMCKRSARAGRLGHLHALTLFQAENILNALLKLSLQE